MKPAPVVLATNGPDRIKESSFEAKISNANFRRMVSSIRDVLFNMRDVLFVVALDPASMAYISPAYDTIWGRPREEVYDRLSAWLDYVHGEDREAVSAFFARCMQGMPLEMEYRVIRPDGVVRWVSARSFPVRDGKGKLVRVAGIAEDITERKEEDKALAETNSKLSNALKSAQEGERFNFAMAGVVDILQTCHTVDEAYPIAGNGLQKAIASEAGVIFMIAGSGDIVEAVSVWGGTNVASEKAFKPNDCWALRLGKVHRFWDSKSSLLCAHVRKPPPNGYVCVPMLAQGVAMGMLYVEGLSILERAFPGNVADPVRPFYGEAVAAAERLSLALANVRLRQELQRASITDPLTGLFNRRFMEAWLEREIARASRRGDPVSLIMMDIDQFKKFNDSFGHQAGDAVLRALGRLLQERTRTQDVVCRYGGEEFAYILGGASVGAARKRAEGLREDVKQLNARYGDTILGGITVSMGIAEVPSHGSNAEELFKTADQALYKAKNEGRDRVVVAPLTRHHAEPSELPVAASR